MDDIIGRAVCGSETLDVISALWPESWKPRGSVRDLSTQFVAGVLPYMLLDVQSIGPSPKKVRGLRLGTWAGKPLTFAMPGQRAHDESRTIESQLSGEFDLSVSDDVLSAAAELKPIFDRHPIAECSVSDSSLHVLMDNDHVDLAEVESFLGDIGPHVRSGARVVVLTEDEKLVHFTFGGEGWTHVELMHGEDITWDVISEYSTLVGRYIRHHQDDVPKPPTRMHTELRVDRETWDRLMGPSRLHLRADLPGGAVEYICPFCIGIGGTFPHWCWSDPATMVHYLVANLQGDLPPDGVYMIRRMHPIESAEGVMGTWSGASLSLRFGHEPTDDARNVSAVAARQYNSYVGGNVFVTDPCPWHQRAEG